MAQDSRISDFSAIAHRYDATRSIPEAVLVACYDRLAMAGLLSRRGTIVDVGCGTGQVSLPLAAMGYSVRGYDVSPSMIRLAKDKGQGYRQVQYSVADARALPERGCAVDSVVFSKLLQHIADWEAACHEMLRILKPGGCIVHMIDRGAFGNAVRRHFSILADGEGCRERFLGLRNPRALAAFFQANDCTEMPIDVSDLAWQKKISYGEALGQIEERLFAEFWYLPEDTHKRIFEATSRWVEGQPSGRATVETMRPFLNVEVFRKAR